MNLGREGRRKEDESNKLQKVIGIVGLFGLIFLDKVSLYSLGWPRTHSVAQVGLGLLIFLPQHPEC